MADNPEFMVGADAFCEVAEKLARAGGRTDYRDFVAHRIHLADIDDDDLRQAMSEWMDSHNVECR